MQFRLPNRIQIYTIIKTPRYAILDRNTGKFFLVDNKGTVLTVSDPVNLPVVAMENFNLEPGGTLRAEDLAALKLVEGTARMYQVGSGARVGDTLLVDLTPGIRVIFPLRDGEVDVLLGSLRVIYTKITTDFPGKYSQIDLRYKNPILR